MNVSDMENTTENARHLVSLLRDIEDGLFGPSATGKQRDDNTRPAYPPGLINQIEGRLGDLNGTLHEAHKVAQSIRERLGFVEPGPPPAPGNWDNHVNAARKY